MKTKKLGTLTRMTRHQAEDYPEGTGGRGRAKSARSRPHRARPAPPDGQKTPRLRDDEAPARKTSTLPPLNCTDLQPDTQHRRRLHRFPVSAILPLDPVAQKVAVRDEPVQARRSPGSLSPMFSPGLPWVCSESPGARQSAAPGLRRVHELLTIQRYESRPPDCHAAHVERSVNAPLIRGANKKWDEVAQALVKVGVNGRAVHRLQREATRECSP